MKMVKQVKGWGIFRNNAKEIEEYGFSFSVLSPDNMEYRYLCTPSDSDFAFYTLDSAAYWVENYK